MKRLIIGLERGLFKVQSSQIKIFNRYQKERYFEQKFFSRILFHYGQVNGECLKLNELNKKIKIDHCEKNHPQQVSVEQINRIDDIIIAQICYENLLESYIEQHDYIRAIDICNTAAKRFKQIVEQKESILVSLYFQARLLFLFHKQDKVEEVKQVSENLIEYYLQNKQKLTSNQLVKAQLIVLETMVRVNLFEFPTLFLQDSQKLLNEFPSLSTSNVELFQYYYLIFGVLYIQKNFKEAIIYGQKAAQTIENEESLLKRHQLLIQGLFNCYQFLQLREQCNLILEKWKNYLFDSHHLAGNNFNPFEESNNQFESNNQYSQPSQYISRYNLLSLEIEQRCETFIGEDNLKAGIIYLENLQKYIDEEKDVCLCLLVNDKLAYFLALTGNIEKGIEISLDTHQKLLMQENNILHNDKLTYQNIYQLKLFYFLLKDYKSSVEWGRKFHKYCQRYSYYRTIDEVLVVSLQSQITSLYVLQQYQEALELSSFALNYLSQQKKKNNEISFEIHMMRAQMHILNKNEDKFIEELKYGIDYYLMSNGLVSAYSEKLYYEALKRICTQFISQKQNVDMKNLIVFGKQYLIIREKYERENESVDLRVALLFQISQQFIKEKKFFEAEEYTEKCLLLAQTDKELKDFYNRLVYQYIPLAIKVSKIEKAEEYLELAKEIYEKDIKDSKAKDNANVSLLQIQSVIFSLKKDFDKSLDFLAKQLVLTQKEHNSITKQQREILRKLLQDETYSKQVKELIAKHQIELNE